MSIVEHQRLFDMIGEQTFRDLGGYPALDGRRGRKVFRERISGAKCILLGRNGSCSRSAVARLSNATDRTARLSCRHHLSREKVLGTAFGVARISTGEKMNANARPVDAVTEYLRRGAPDSELLADADPSSLGRFCFDLAME